MSYNPNFQTLRATQDYIESEVRRQLAVLAGASLASTIYTAKGDILAAVSAAVPQAVGVGSNGQLLTADSTAVQGVRWATAAAGIAPSAYTAKGAVLIGSAPSVPTALAVGANGQALEADSTAATGTKWADTVNPTDYPAKGSILVASAANAPTALAVGTNGQSLVADSTTATGTKWAASGGGLTVQSTQLAADVSISAAADVFTDILSLSLVAGTWFIVTNILLSYSAIASTTTLKLWESGTPTTIASGSIKVAASATNSLGLAGVVTIGATTTYKASACASIANSVTTVKAQATNTTGGNTASTLIAIKVA